MLPHLWRGVETECLFGVKAAGGACPRQVAGHQTCDALYILSSSFANQHRAKLAELALAYKRPAMYGFREFAQAGG
jgi:hypothetical protein